VHFHELVHFPGCRSPRAWVHAQIMGAINASTYQGKKKILLKEKN
jgi:hypothetical protein